MHHPLPVDRLRPVLQAWGLETADVVAIVPGVTADVFLVMQDGDRWVAKVNYEYRDHFEVGLRASPIVHERTAGPGFDVAVPVLTDTGGLTEMVGWPDGNDHPVALLTYVRGDPLTKDEPDAATVIGDVCGRVHRALLDVAPADVALHSIPSEPDGNYPDRDAGEFGWLHSLWRELEHRCWAVRGDLRHAVSVWDGPDIRRRPAGLGVLDFGHCGWHPVVHVVANRSLIASLSDETLMTPFLDAVEQHLPLTAAEREHLDLHRLRNAAIYARWVAMEKVARRAPDSNDLWFGELLDFLRRGLPLVGMARPGLPS